MKRAAKRVLVGFGVATAALVLAAAGTELAVRHFDVYGVNYYPDVARYRSEAVTIVPEQPPDRWRIFENKPAVRLELKTFDYLTDERGLRTGEDRSLPGSASQRVLFLGDSVTLAWGVDDADSWVRILEREATAADGRPLACMNAGHLMYDTTQQAALLRAWGPVLEPEVVLLTWIFNDLHPTYDQLASLHSLEPPEPENFVQRFFWATRSLLRFQSELSQVRDEEERWKYPPYSYYPDGWPRCAEALADVKATCETLGARLVINDHASPEVPELARWCEENGVPRLATALSEDDRRRYRNSVIDSHLNAEGNRVVADQVLAGLRELGILR